MSPGMLQCDISRRLLLLLLLLFSDHALVVCRLTAMNMTPTTAERLVRG